MSCFKHIESFKLYLVAAQAILIDHCLHISNLLSDSTRCGFWFSRILLLPVVAVAVKCLSDCVRNVQIKKVLKIVV